MKKVSFTEMKNGTKEDYLFLDKHEKDFASKTADRILKFMSGLTETLEGYQISRLEHSLQTATRAFNDKAGDEMIVAALFHDIIITLGFFSMLSLEINLSIVAAVLTIVGYSMNDTVVIFDRVRENLRKYSDIKIFELTNISINETLSRTIITSATTLLALLAIFFFGGEILKGFSLAMILGVVFGTYSSIYIANTILVRLRVSQKTVLREDDNKTV